MHVRRNAASLSPEEWKRFNSAVIKLKHTFFPGSAVSIYDMFVAIHLSVTQLINGPQAGVDGAHNHPAFLPWHREFIRRYEAMLNWVEPGVTLPYWNWGLGTNAESSSLFTDQRIGPAGSGGASGREVATGYFAHNPNALNSMGWEIRPELRVFGDALQRNSSLNVATLPSATTLNTALTQPNYNLFRPALEGPHGSVHLWVGRDMSRMTSPNDPIFFLHHAQVDRIWARWQIDHPGSANYNPANIGGPGQRLNDNMWPWDGGASSPGPVLRALVPRYAATDLVKPIDVLDHHELGYCYDDEPECPCPNTNVHPPVTRRFGETGPTTALLGEESVPTTLRIGEEGVPTTIQRGEEVPTTLAIGEEHTTTLMIGEEGPGTDPRIDDPPPPFDRPDGRRFSGNPFGDF